jgi:hypothetical protein
MKKLVTFASDVRASALLCCSAAVLLTACGGGSSDTQGLTQTAARVYDSAAKSDATVAATASADAPATLAMADQDTANTANIAAPTRLLASTVVGSTSDQITELYVSLLDRQPDPAGLAYWTQAVNNGLSIDAVAAQIKSSAEYVNRPAAVEPALAATTYHLYVATTGSDSNPGTKVKPFKTITKASTVAKPSTTVHVAAGTYKETVRTAAKATSSGRIIFLSDTKWGAKIIGSGTEDMWHNTGNYTDIVNFDVSGPGRLGILNLASYVTMSGNHVHDLKVTGGCTGSGGAGIMNGSYTASDNNMIGNVVHDIGVPGACNAVQGIYHANLRGKIQNNIVYRASSFGIHLWHAANNVVVSNNTSFANGSKSMGGGIVMGTGDKPGGIVMNNTRVVNNIAINNPRGGIMQYCYSGVNCIGATNTVANNLVYGNGTNITMKVGKATGTITADPQFVSYAASGTAGNYRLKSTSPAVNKGTSSYAPTTDIDGVARPRGGAFDIGAYESF